MLLLAATSRLAGNALDWYNRQSTTVISSWAEVKKGLLEYFQRKVSFTQAMTRINERVWIHLKEKFIDYANEKLNIMQFLDLSERDQIDLLAASIKLPMIQVAATDLRIEKLSDFLEHIRRVTEAAVTPFSGHKQQGPKPSANSAAKTSKDIVCRNCQRKGHVGFATKDCRSQVICYNFQQPGYIRPQCPSKSVEQSKAVAKTDGRQSSVVAIVSETLPAVPYVSLINLNRNHCSINALVDSGSQISIVKKSIYNEYLNNIELKPIAANQSFSGVNNTPIKMLGIVECSIKIDGLSRDLNAQFFVVPDKTIRPWILLGRTFFINENLLVTQA